MDLVHIHHKPYIVTDLSLGIRLGPCDDVGAAEIEVQEQRRAENPIIAPRVLGVDEKHIAHIMRGTLVDIVNGTLLDMIEDNTRPKMEDAIKKMKDWDKNIEVVTTDMANNYLSWMPSMLPNATFVVDKFHVIQDVVRRVTTAKIKLYNYRKGIIDNIQDPEEKARQKEILRIVNDNKRLFNYSMDHIAEDERRSLKIDTVMKEFPEFRLLRMMYYYVEDMYTKETREEAEEAWNEWQELLPPTGKKAYKKWCELYSVDENCFEAFQSLKRSGFTQYKPYILNYFNEGCRFTNAATEGLNSLIEQINISGNGYRFKHLRAKALYTSLFHEHTQYSIDIHSVNAWKPTIEFAMNFNRIWQLLLGTK